MKVISTVTSIILALIIVIIDFTFKNRLSLKYNSGGSYFDESSAVVYHQQAVVTYGFLTLTLSETFLRHFPGKAKHKDEHRTFGRGLTTYSPGAPISAAIEETFTIVPPAPPCLTDVLFIASLEQGKQRTTLLLKR
nr:hypothetical protein [Pontibacter sp. 172403-2]